MKRSSYIKNTILGMAVKSYMENKEIVTKELLMPEEKNEKDVKKQAMDIGGLYFYFN
jgi:hypothetical protein